MLNVQVAAQPIIWSNDDFHDLGGQTSLQQCLKEMKAAGYKGTELGHKFPKDAAELGAILKDHDLQLVSGWHSSYLASRPLAEEIPNFKKHLDFLIGMGCQVAIVAECTGRTYNEAGKPLDWEFKKETFSNEDWKKIVGGLEQFAKIASDRGLKLVYHHHMGTGIQNLKQIDRLMDSTKETWLLGDTGHLAFAGENPVEVFRKYQDRIGHVHLKNVRPKVIAQARKENWSFDKSVREGAFTVPGDGGIDFRPIFEILNAVNYQGWVVVEAEQDPEKANPLEYAKKGFHYIQDSLRKISEV